MSFSASTCLTNIGPLTLSTMLDIYSNPTSPTNKGVYVGQVQVASIQGVNCPYTFLVPNGTIVIRFFDPITKCYADIDVQDNNLCNTCNLDFNSFSASTTGRLVVGRLTGSCQSNITDYKINWYVNGETTPRYTSGFGTQYQPYSYTHPLTGTSAPMVVEGSYIPVIDKVKINGITFSSSNIPGAVKADLNCFDDIGIHVTGFTCSNGTSTDPIYTHEIRYSGASQGQAPIPSNASFKLTPTTNFFAWKFKGYSIPDKLKLTLIASAYSEPILLEFFEIGSDLPGDQFGFSYPQSADTSAFFYKVTSLSGLTINDGDRIEIEVTPNPNYPASSWDFYFKCLETFNCQLPDMDGRMYLNSVTGITGSCDTIQINGRISGITNNQYSSYDMIKYYPVNLNGLLSSNGQVSFSTVPLYQTNISCQGGQGGYNSLCSQAGSPITYEKSPGLFKITYDDQTVLSLDYNIIKTRLDTLINPIYSGDPTNISYYSWLTIKYPAVTPTTVCSDSLTYRTFYVHQLTQVTTGQTGSQYYLQLTLPTVINQTSYTSCNLFCSTELKITEINNSSTGSTFNYTGTTNNGVRNTQIVETYRKLSTIVRGQTGTTVFSSIQYTTGSQLDTIPSSSTTKYDVVIDNDFNIGSGFNGTIKDILIQPDGKILVGGFFSLFSGQSQNRLIRLNSNGTKDTSFNIGSGFGANVYSLALQSDGKILVGGGFTSFSGQSQNNCIIRLNTDGTKDTSFINGTNFNSDVNDITIQPDGKILVGGGFTSFSGQSQNRLIRLNTNGSKDNSFDIGSGFNNQIKKIKLQSDGKILVSGLFTQFSGQSQNRLIRLNTDGSKDTTFLLNPTGFTQDTILDIAVKPNDEILVAGGVYNYFFTQYSVVGRAFLIKLSKDGVIDTNTLNLNISGYINTLEFDNFNDLLIGGSIGQFVTPKNDILRGINSLNDDYLDTNSRYNFNSGFTGNIEVIKKTNDGMFVGGNMSTYNGTPVNLLTKLKFVDSGTKEYVPTKNISCQSCSSGILSKNPYNSYFNPGGFIFYQNYRYELINPSDVRDFSIYYQNQRITPNEPRVLIYTFSGGTVTYVDTNYFIV